MKRSGDAAPPAAPLHLLKMAVGIADLDDLRRVRAERSRQYGGSWVYTRNQPRRAEAVLAGGSLYWVIRGQIRARQRIAGLRSERDDKGRAYCLIAVDPVVVPTLLRPWRPFQGWRYLSPADAPPDAPGGAILGQAGAARAEDPMPERLVAELRSLGLL
ncbi:MAG TPA: DUF1489 domain-containing protein [Stellaceae bacterium]|nr:DUF1489 domain-containing protein [Stellaceae bacterium]